MVCLSAAKMNMLADVLRPADAPTTDPAGQWNYTQDPVSGSLKRVWIDDDPNTPQVEGNVIVAVPCLVRGIMGTGIRGVGTTQDFGAIYKNIEWVRMTYPTSFTITKRDRIIRIRDLEGNLIWVEEEREGFPATTFEVMGVTPVVNGFGKAIENMALLKRTDVQSV